MPEGRIERWYWIRDSDTGESTIRGGRLRDVNHNEFFIEHIEDPGVVADLIKSFENGEHPRIIYKEEIARRNIKTLIVTEVIQERE